MERSQYPARDLLLILALTPPAYHVRGVVLQHLWRWFLLPALALPVPSVGLCAGIALCASFLVRHPAPEAVDLAKSFANEFAFSTVVFIIGAAVHFCVG